MLKSLKLLLASIFIIQLPSLAHAYAKDYNIRFVEEKLPGDSTANMELVLNDFFNLLLNKDERDIVRTELLKNIQIVGYYKGTKEVKNVTYETYTNTSTPVGTFSLPSKTKYKREINLLIKAKAAAVSIEESKVSFSLPVKTGKGGVFELYAIDIRGDIEVPEGKYPKTNLDFTKMPRHHHINSGYMTHRHHFLIDVEPAGKTVSGQNYRVDKYYYPSIKRDNFPVNGWIVQLNMTGDGKPGSVQVKAPRINTNKFTKGDIYFYYDTSRISPYAGDKADSYGLSSPPENILPPVWQGLESVFFDYNIHHTFDESYHKKEANLAEVLVLKADIPYVTHYGWKAGAKGKAEKWTKVRGKLTGISGGAAPNNADDSSEPCGNFKYKVVYPRDGGEYKFFSHRRSNGDVQIINGDITPLLELKKEFAEIYASKEKYGEYYKVCERRVDDAIYILTAPKEKLEEEYEFYKKLITKENSDKTK